MTPLGLLVLVSLGLARERPEVRSELPPPAPVPAVHTLSDGTPVWVLHTPGAALVRLEVSFLEGHLHTSDPQALRLAGALLGEAPAGGARAWSRRLERAGGVAALGVGAQRSWADVEVLAGREEVAVALAVDATVAARFPRREVREFREAWTRSGTTGWRSGSRVLEAATAAATYPADHPRARVDGPAVWAEVSPRRVRRAWAAALDAPRAIVVAGDVDVETLLPTLDAAWRGGGAGRVATSVPPPAGEARLILVDHPGAPQALVRGSLPAPGRLDPELPAAQVLTQVLGGGFTSRLNVRLREDLGITYGAGASLSLAASHGRLLMDVTVSPGDAGLALDELNDALLMLELRPPDAAEVEAARRALRIAEDRAAERLDGRVYPYGEALALGRSPGAVAADRAARDAVVPSEVQVAAAAVAGADDIAWIVVGDAERLVPVLQERGWIPDAIWSGRDLVEGGRRP